MNNSQTDFPINIMPPKMQDVILSLVKHLGFSTDYTAVSILLTVAAAIGKTYKLQVKNTWLESCCIYLCLVGRPGANKTHPLVWAIKPLMDATERNFNSLKVVEGSQEEMMSTEIPEPFVEQLVVNNITPESTMQVMAERNIRFLIWSDEISGFLRNINKYNSGSDTELLLSIFSGQTVIVNRKTEAKFMIKDPYACIGGTTQPEVLKNLFQKAENNGLFDRFLFCYLEDAIKSKMIKEDLSPAIIVQYNKIINKLLSLPLKENEESNILCFNAEAEEISINWYNENADKINDEPDDRIRGVYIKLDIYFYRFALIFQILRWACDEGTLENVDTESTKNAIALVEYFRNMNIKTLKLLSPDAYETMTDLQKKVYDNIRAKENTDGEFDLSTGLMIAGKVGMSERNFKYFLKRTDLFKRLKAGKYKKLF